jgi:hypothetical protein
LKSDKVKTRVVVALFYIFTAIFSIAKPGLFLGVFESHLSENEIRTNTIIDQHFFLGLVRLTDVFNISLSLGLKY